MICRFYPKAAEIFWSGIIVMTNLLAQIINGLSVGSIYALMAVGYSLIYSLLNFTNFAHSITVTIGAFCAFLSL